LAKDIHKGMLLVYGDNCLLCKAVYRWVEKPHEDIKNWTKMT